MHSQRDKVHPPQLQHPSLRHIQSHRKPFAISHYVPPLTSQNRLKKSKIRSSHPPLALLTPWTTSPPSSRPTKGIPTLLWKPPSFHPTSTESARTRRRESLRLGARTRLVLWSAGHQVRWFTISQNSGESRSIPSMRCCSNIRGRAQTRTRQFRESSRGSRSSRPRRT